MNTKIASNVLEFIDKASSLYGQFQEQRHAQEMFSNCVDIGMQSPIEHLFWIACHTLCESRYIKVNPEYVCDKTGAETLGDGIFIRPQVQVGTYRVDFEISQNGVGPNDLLTPIVVELDGHDFHDKDKRQRSYEKARDRYLVKAGYRVLHFTGSDVVADPFKVAFEALDMVGFGACGPHEYNPKDPMDMGV